MEVQQMMAVQAKVKPSLLLHVLVHFLGRTPNESLSNRIHATPCYTWTTFPFTMEIRLISEMSQIFHLFHVINKLDYLILWFFFCWSKGHSKFASCIRIPVIRNDNDYKSKFPHVLMKLGDLTLHYTFNVIQVTYTGFWFWEFHEKSDTEVTIKYTEFSQSHQNNCALVQSTHNIKQIFNKRRLFYLIDLLRTARLI